MGTAFVLITDKFTVQVFGIRLTNIFMGVLVAFFGVYCATKSHYSFCQTDTKRVDCSLPEGDKG